ncbi:MAG: phosphotransferase [Candidatus Krumholzibacteria bacterium]|nr:phosphotransferase [Candidatus Krumholzibacteria bacterium]
MNDALRGMILGAGYGTRLAPVTDHVPKPLLNVAGRPLLGHVIDSLDRAGVVDIGINTHHLSGMMADYIESRMDRDRFTLFPEKEILGTGGALDGAREFLGGASNFLLHNGDVLCEVDLEPLVAEHSGTGALATLLLVDWPAVNSVTLGDDGRIASIGGRPSVTSASTARNLTYTGIGIFSSDLLKDIGPGFSSLIDPLVRALELDPASVRGYAPDRIDWSDLGTLARYLAAQEGRSVDESESSGMELDRITGHGSDRRFWRMAVGDWSAVAMISPPQDQEFERFTEIAGFLESRNLGGPALLSVAKADHAVLMEDLGPDSLLSLVQCEGSGSDSVSDAYQRTVDHLLDLQSATEEARTQCPSAVDRCLDYDSLRWETGYFRDRFLVGHLGLNLADLGELDDEFHALAEAVAAQPQVLIHRDFQSQNIHLQGDRIRLVDFQGMRLGPLTYDLMSLLLDPYVALEAGLRAELLDRFAAASAGTFSTEDIRAMSLAAGLQRIMQALGAYGFLGHVKGKRSYLEHIPAGLATLREILGEPEWKTEVANRWLPGSMPVLERFLDSMESL